MNCVGDWHGEHGDTHSPLLRTRLLDTGLIKPVAMEKCMSFPAKFYTSMLSLVVIHAVPGKILLPNLVIQVEGAKTITG